ncbi:MAG TPA: hypothetical protein DCP91_12915, partial [Eggerthellaceae bacterium]|nr:hypothetical protein [Eggerthellaceae bacterium]
MIAGGLVAAAAAVAIVSSMALPASANYVEPGHTVQGSTTTNNGVVNPGYLFDTGIKLDPNAWTYPEEDVGKFIEIVGSDGQAIQPVGGFHYLPAYTMVDGKRIDVRTADTSNPVEVPANNLLYQSKQKWETNRYSLMHDNNHNNSPIVSFYYDDVHALDNATIKLTYPFIGTYNGREIGMYAEISNIEFMRHPASASVLHKENQYSFTRNANDEITGFITSSPTNGVHHSPLASDWVGGPAMQIAMLPQYGIFQWNIHQDDFNVRFYYTDTASDGVTKSLNKEAPVKNANDIYMTFSSLSVYGSLLGDGTESAIPREWRWARAYIQHEKVKALANIDGAYVTTDTHIHRSNTGTNLTYTIEDDDTVYDHGYNERYTDLVDLGVYAYQPDPTKPASNVYYNTTRLWEGMDFLTGYAYTPSQDEDANWPYYFADSGEYAKRGAEDGYKYTMTARSDPNNQWPLAYNDTIGDKLFPRNAISLRFSGTNTDGTNDIRFRMNTPDNSFWYTLFPTTLTGAVPGEPKISVSTSPVKQISEDDTSVSDDLFNAEGANTELQDDLLNVKSAVHPGSKLRYTVEQIVNNIGQDTTRRYDALKMTANIPAGVTPDPSTYRLAIEDKSTTPSGLIETTTSRDSTTGVYSSYIG